MKYHDCDLALRCGIYSGGSPWSIVPGILRPGHFLIVLGKQHVTAVNNIDEYLLQDESLLPVQTS